MDQLESAACIVMSPGDAVSSEQRKEAEYVFLQLRNTKNPFNLCRQILETAKADYLLFEACTLLRLGIIREWNSLKKEDVIELRQYILHYLMNNFSKPSFVREILSQVVAIMVKRGCMGDSVADRGQFLSEVEQLMSVPDNNMRLLGCSIVNALMQEYAVTVKSADVGLTWETHFKAKKQFEGTDLRRIFHFIVNILGEIVKVEGKLSSEMNDLLYKLISIAEDILAWSFIFLQLPRRLMSVFEQDPHPSLRPSIHWKETFLDSSIIQLFFKLYWKVRGQWEMSYHALNCLIQFASLNGAVLVNRDVRVRYLTQYLECLFSFLNNTQLMEEEALGFSNIFRKLLRFFPSTVLSELSEGMLQELIQHLTHFTCKFAEGSASEESLDQEDQMYMEAFEQMLMSWSCILQEGDLSQREQVKQSSVVIFDTYVKCHIGPPNGTRQSIEVCDIPDSVQSDRVAFRDQLSLISLCGLQNPGHSIDILTKLLEQSIDKFRLLLSRAASADNCAIPSSDSQVMDSLYEDIHWILLISGFLTTMGNEGEIALIPYELMGLSIRSATNSDLLVTMNMLANPALSPSEVQDADRADPLIRLISNVLRLCEIESQAMSANLGKLLSPEVSSSLMWFLERFSHSYLLQDETFYSEYSVAINSCFGKDSDGGKWTINFLLRTVENVLRLRSSEPCLIKDTVDLWVSMTDNKERATILMESETLMELVKLAHPQNLGGISRNAQKGLIQGLVMCGSALTDPQKKAKYWEHVLDPLVTKFQAIIASDTFSKDFHSERVKNWILFYIDNFVGVVQGCLISTAQCLFSRLILVMEDCVRVMDICHNYTEVVESIMELFVQCGRRMLCYLIASSSKRLYKVSVDLVSVYAKHNIGKRNFEGACAEDDQCRDVQLLIELLTSLLSKDFIDLAPITQGGDNQNDSIAGADVCLFGLNIIMPLISKELLQLPSISSQYYKMIAFIAEIYPSKLCQLNEDLMNNLLLSIELGLTTFGPDVGSFSFDFLSILGSHLYKNDPSESLFREKLKSFLKLVLDLIISQQVNSDLMQGASSALFALICCFQADYQELVGSLLQCQGDPDIRMRLAESFTQLTADVTLQSDRTNRLRFRDNFDKFIANVRGFLLVK